MACTIASVRTAGRLEYASVGRRSQLVVVLLATAGMSLEACGRSIPGAPSGGTLTVSSITMSPSGAGLENATQFTFTANVGPASPQTVFDWQFGDGGSSSTTGPTATHLFTRAGTFTVQVTVSNSAGQVGASTPVRVASLVGTWLGTVTGHMGQPPITSFDLTVHQPLERGAPTTPLAASWIDNAGCRRTNLMFGSVSHPRSVTVGAQQLSCNNGNDFYLTGTTDDQVQRITGTCTGGCQFQMTRRLP